MDSKFRGSIHWGILRRLVNTIKEKKKKNSRKDVRKVTRLPTCYCVIAASEAGQPARSTFGLMTAATVKTRRVSYR